MEITTNEQLVKQYQDGDYSALDELTKNNLDLVKFVANKYSIHCNFIDYDDLYQVGWTGFFRAVQTYRADLPNSAQFSTWAVYWIRQAVQRYLDQKTSKAVNDISIQEEIGEDITLEDTLEAPDTVLKLWRYIERRELRAELETVMDERLSLKEKEVLKLRFGWDDNIEWDFQSIANIYSKTRQGIHTTYKAAILKIRQSPWGRQRIKEHLIEKGLSYKYIPTRTIILEQLWKLNSAKVKI